MTGTYTKAIIEKNQAHILSFWDYPADFVGQVEATMRGYHIRTPYRAIMEMVEGGFFLIENRKIEGYLKTLGLTDKKRIDKYKNPNTGQEGAFGLYEVLLARDGAKLYEKMKKMGY